MALGGCSWVVLQRPEWLQVRCCSYYPRTTDASSCCLALAHLQASAPQKAGIVRIFRPDRCVVGDRIPSRNNLASVLQLAPSLARAKSGAACTAFRTTGPGGTL